MNRLRTLAPLVWQFARRELGERYRGSMLGFAWAFLVPAAMVAMYTFVFGVVFRARWGQADGGPAEYALFMYAGLVPYLFVVDVLGRAPLLLVGHATLVKKVAFPLPALALASTIAAAVHMVIGFGVLLVLALLTKGALPWTAALAPVVVLPLIIGSLALMLVLASSGVFLRDLGPFVAAALPVLMFLSPVFYPLSAVPESFRAFMLLNPLTVVIESLRAVLLDGTLPSMGGWLLQMLIATAGLAVGLAWFRRLRPGFGDSL
jgi:lipopolysaccharide transport system permease protein